MRYTDLALLKCSVILSMKNGNEQSLFLQLATLAVYLGFLAGVCFARSTSGNISF